MIQKTIELKREIEALMSDVGKNLPDPEKRPSLIKARKAMYRAEVAEAEANLAVARKENALGRKLEPNDVLMQIREQAWDHCCATRDATRSIENRKQRGRALSAQRLDSAGHFLEEMVLFYLETAGEEE